MDNRPPLWEYAIVAIITVSVIASAGVYLGVELCKQVCNAQDVRMDDTKTAVNKEE